MRVEIEGKVTPERIAEIVGKLPGIMSKAPELKGKVVQLVNATLHIGVCDENGNNLEIPGGRERLQGIILELGY